MVMMSNWKRRTLGLGLPTIEDYMQELAELRAKDDELKVMQTKLWSEHGRVRTEREKLEREMMPIKRKIADLVSAEVDSMREG